MPPAWYSMFRKMKLWVGGMQDEAEELMRGQLIGEYYSTQGRFSLILKAEGSYLSVLFFQVRGMG